MAKTKSAAKAKRGESKVRRRVRKVAKVAFISGAAAWAAIGILGAARTAYQNRYDPLPPVDYNWDDFDTGG